MTGKKFTRHLRKDKANEKLTWRAKKLLLPPGKSLRCTYERIKQQHDDTAPQGVTQRNDSFHYDTQHQRPTRHNDLVNPIINHKFWGVLVDSDLDNGG